MCHRTGRGVVGGFQSTFGISADQGSVIGLGGKPVALIVEPGIGRLGAGQPTACLADLRVNLVRARVLNVQSGPLASGP
jgi:hypothetical protein